ncbi:MAG: LAGLIDADG family homing endonuclease [Nanoarchaeota archaeon]
MVNRLSKEQIQEVVEKYQNGKSSPQLAKEYEITASSICGLLKRRNVKIREQTYNKRKYEIDENFFEKIDTEEKGYWLGFLWADGYLNKVSLNLTLSIKDKEHLKKFLISLKTNRPLQEYNYSYADIVRVNVPNKKIIQDLRNLDFLNRKGFPKISINLTNHFLRGVFDGDGCIRLTKNNDAYFSLMAEKEFLEFIQKNIFSKININQNTKLKKRHKDSKSNVLAIELGGRDNIKKLYDYLYKNSTIFLERKKKIFEEIEKERPQERRCSIIGCNKKHYGLGLCKNHYYTEYGSIKRKERYLENGN